MGHLCFPFLCFFLFAAVTHFSGHFWFNLVTFLVMRQSGKRQWWRRQRQGRRNTQYICAAVWRVSGLELQRMLLLLLLDCCLKVVFALTFRIYNSSNDPEKITIPKMNLAVLKLFAVTVYSASHDRSNSANQAFSSGRKMRRGTFLSEGSLSGLLPVKTRERTLLEWWLQRNTTTIITRTTTTTLWFVIVLLHFLTTSNMLLASYHRTLSGKLLTNIFTLLYQPYFESSYLFCLQAFGLKLVSFLPPARFARVTLKSYDWMLIYGRQIWKTPPKFHHSAVAATD